MKQKVMCQVRIMVGKGVGMGPGVDEMNQLFASPLVTARRGVRAICR